MPGDFGRGVSARIESTSTRMPGRAVDALLPARELARVLPAAATTTAEVRGGRRGGGGDGGSGGRYSQGGRWKCGEEGARSPGCTGRRSRPGSAARYE